MYDIALLRLCEFVGMSFRLLFFWLGLAEYVKKDMTPISDGAWSEDDWNAGFLDTQMLSHHIDFTRTHLG
jgi:hypothetical protein